MNFQSFFFTVHFRKDPVCLIHKALFFGLIKITLVGRSFQWRHRTSGDVINTFQSYAEARFIFT